MRVLTLISLLFIGFLSGCASFSSGSKQSVTVITSAEGAACSLTDSKGRVWYIENTPGAVLVKKGDGPISVICKKEGYRVGNGQIKESYNPALYGNILMPPGFLLDVLTGSAEQYESSIDIDMESDKGAKKPWE